VLAVLCLVLVALPALAQQTVVSIYTGALPYFGSIEGTVTGITVSGTVYPVAGALVSAWRLENPGLPRAWGVWSKEELPPGIAKRLEIRGPLAWTVTDQKGSYEFGELPGGPYLIKVEAPWYLPTRIPVRILPGTTVKQDVYLSVIGGAVGGVVYDVYNGAPLGGARVVLCSASSCAPRLKGKHLKEKGWELDLAEELDDEGAAELAEWGVRIARTDETGCYYLFAPASSYTLFTVRPGYAPAVQTVSITAKTLARQDIGLTRKPAPQVLKLQEKHRKPPKKTERTQKGRKSG